MSQQRRHSQKSSAAVPALPCLAPQRLSPGDIQGQGIKSPNSVRLGHRSLISAVSPPILLLLRAGSGALPVSLGAWMISAGRRGGRTGSSSFPRKDFSRSDTTIWGLLDPTTIQTRSQPQSWLSCRMGFAHGLVSLSLYLNPCPHPGTAL